MTDQHKSCPPPPDLDQRFESVAELLKESGASQACKSIFSSAFDSKITKHDFSAAAYFLVGGGSASSSFTDAQQRMRENLEKEGCTDLFYNLNQQVTSSQAILCEISNTESTTELAGSANASVRIVQAKPTPEMLKLREETIKKMSPPIAPIPPPSPYTKEAYEMYNIAMKNYNDALRVQKQQIDSILGTVNISKSQFRNKANVDMRSVSSTKNISTTAIVEQVKQVAKAEAINEIKNKTGFGANSDTIKSLVSNKISSKQQNITNSVKNSVQSVKLEAAADASFVLVAYGSINLENVVFDQYAEARIITENIMQSATNLGKTIALEILTEGHNSTIVDKSSEGQETVLEEVLRGQLELSKANAEGAAKLFEKATEFVSSGMMSMFAGLLIPIIVIGAIIFFFPGLVGKLPGMKIIIPIVVILLLMWLFGIWPFGEWRMREYRATEGSEYRATEGKKFWLNTSPPIIPEYVKRIPSNQSKKSRADDLMHVNANLEVPGWKWGEVHS